MPKRKYMLKISKNISDVINESGVESLFISICYFGNNRKLLDKKRRCR